MAHLVIARKYRPASFDQVVGQEGVIRTLQRALERDRVAHAYLFSGVRGVGKTTMARLFAKCLNCHAGRGPNPCGTCPSCDEITRSCSVDVLEYDAASHTGVDQMRDIIALLSYVPQRDRYKIVILDEVHMLSTSSFNALLKTLEEPPPHAVFLFATTEPHKIPATVLSRLQHFQFGRLSLSRITARLQEIAAKEGIAITGEALRVIAHAADGSMRDGQSHLEKVAAFGEGELDAAQAEFILGTVSKSAVSGLVAALAAGDMDGLLAALNRHVAQGDDLERVAGAVTERLRALTLVGVTRNPADVLDLTAEEVEALRSEASGQSAEAWARLLDLFVRGLPSLRNAPDPRLALELLCVKGALLPRLIPVGKLAGLLPEVGGSGAGLPSSGGGMPAPSRGPAQRAAPVQREAPTSAAPAIAVAPDLEAPAAGGPITFTGITPFEVIPDPEPPAEVTAKDPAAWVRSQVGRLPGVLAAVFDKVCAIKVDTATARLELVLPDEFPIFLHMLDEPANRSALEALGQRLLGRPFSVSAHLASADDTDLGRLANLETEEPGARQMEQALQDPAVQKVLKAFKAEILRVDPIH